MAYGHEDDLGFFTRVIAREYEVVVAEEEGRPIAFLALSPGEVQYLYVDPPFQGAGVGSRLLGFAIERNPAGLSLSTHQKNHRARRFYAKHGFRPVAFGVSPLPECEPDLRLFRQGTHVKEAEQQGL